MLPAVIARNLLKQSGRLAAVCSRGMNERKFINYNLLRNRYFLIIIKGFTEVLLSLNVVF